MRGHSSDLLLLWVWRTASRDKPDPGRLSQAELAHRAQEPAPGAPYKDRGVKCSVLCSSQTQKLCFQGVLNKIPPAHLFSVSQHGLVPSQDYPGLTATVSGCTNTIESNPNCNYQLLSKAFPTADIHISKSCPFCLHYHAP